MLRKAFACFLLLLELAVAIPQFTFTPFLTGITAGESYTLTWTGASGPVTITLVNGPSSSLKKVETIISGATGTSYIWTPPLSLSTGTYALEIADSTGPNYSEQFTINGAATGTSSSSAVSSLASVAPSTSSSGTQSTNSPSFSSTSISSSFSSSSTTSSSSFSTTISSASRSESAATNPQPHNGLSTGAKAGIGVGAAFGALLLIGLVFFAFWYGRHSANRSKKATPEDGGAQKAELEAVEANQKAELEKSADVAEMGGHSMRTRRKSWRTGGELLNLRGVTQLFLVLLVREPSWRRRGSKFLR